MKPIRTKRGSSSGNPELSGGGDIFWHQVSLAKRFCLNLSPDRNAKLAIVSGGREKCAQNYNVEREGFPFYCIEFVASGEGYLELGKRKYILTPGTVFSYGPGVRHVMRSSSSSPMVKYFIDFAGRNAQGMLSRISLAPGSIRKTFDTGQVLKYLEEIIEHGSRGSRNAQGICDALLECLMLVLDEKMMPYKKSEGRSAVPTFLRIKEHMSKNYARTDDIRKIASECGVDVTYLCRLFKRFEHESPYRHILRLKMNDAAKMLQSDDLLIKEVAEKCGYNDQYQFSRCFKNIFAISPASYRRLAVRRG
ncbi:MAG TPA: hypothetical protein DET40_06775 [Lentisphaeria bacterium]|nr:MAG: hypothetical protein A2X45_07525 [Lentisphaerae bacterium GWF2_50_93]HCE43233.1 hypothetical protein [Lentisphaeria bacterium]